MPSHSETLKVDGPDMQVYFSENRLQGLFASAEIHNQRELQKVCRFLVPGTGH